MFHTGDQILPRMWNQVPGGLGQILLWMWGEEDVHLERESVTCLLLNFPFFHSSHLCPWIPVLLEYNCFCLVFIPLAFILDVQYDKLLIVFLKSEFTQNSFQKSSFHLISNLWFKVPTSRFHFIMGVIRQSCDLIYVVIYADTVTKRRRSRFSFCFIIYFVKLLLLIYLDISCKRTFAVG